MSGKEGLEAASSQAGLEPIQMRCSGAQLSEGRVSVEPGLRARKQESVPRSPSHKHSRKSPAGQSIPREWDVDHLPPRP